MDRFTKTCLLLIVALLAIIAFRPLAAPPAVHAFAAASPKELNYLSVAPINPSTQGIQKVLDEQATQGWQLVATVQGGAGAPVLIFEK